MSDNRLSSHFIADALGLDFLNAIAPPSHSKIGSLTTGEDLMAWLIAADLAPSDALDGIRAIAVPGELNAVAAQARALGEWFRGFILEHKGASLPDSAIGELEPLNRILERDLRFGQVRSIKPGHGRREPSGLVWCSQRPWRTPDSLLLPIARVMAELVCDKDFSHVRKCEGPGCPLLFLDRTRGHTRRWCSMASCGNRAKQAARRGSRL